MITKIFRSQFASINEKEKIISLYDSLEEAYQTIGTPVIGDVQVNINESGILDVYSSKVVYSNYFYYDCDITIDKEIILRSSFGLGNKTFSYDQLTVSNTRQETVGFWYWLEHKKLSFKKKELTLYFDYQIAVVEQPIELHYHGWELRIIANIKTKA